MKKGLIWILGLSIIFLWSFTSKVSNDLSNIQDPTIDDIVASYKKAIIDWPKPNIDKGVKWSEFSSIKRDSLYFVEQDRPDVILGKMLFLIQNFQNLIKFPAVLVTIQKGAGQTEDEFPSATIIF